MIIAVMVFLFVQFILNIKKSNVYCESVRLQLCRFFCGVFCGNSGTLRLFGDSGEGAIREIENIGIIEAIGKIESIGAIDVFYCLTFQWFYMLRYLGVSLTANWTLEPSVPTVQTLCYLVFQSNVKRTHEPCIHTEREKKKGMKLK